MLEKIPERLRRTKLWMSVLTPFATAVFVILVKKFQLPLTEIEVSTLAALMVSSGVAYVFAQGKIDAEEKKAKGLSPLP